MNLQGGLSIDKDVKLLEVFSGIPDLPVARLSPVRFGPTFTRDFLDNDDPDRVTKELERDILACMDFLPHMPAAPVVMPSAHFTAPI